MEKRIVFGLNLNSNKVQRPGGDCPRNGKVLNSHGSVCAAAALVSSAKSACIHPERKEPYLCPSLGDEELQLISSGECKR